MKKTAWQKFKELFEATSDVPLQEKTNIAQWLESRLHLSLTQMADDMFGGGNVTREERKILSGAIGGALDTYHQFLVDNAPQLFQRRPWEDAPSETGTVSASEGSPTPSPSPSGRTQLGEGSVELMESGSAAMFVPLVEKAVRNDGTIPVKIIQPGWGSSGYYPAEVLERDGPRIFRKGTKMFWNHQTMQEEAERPEGDLNHLAAELTSDARYERNGKAGPGLYADAKVFEHYKSAVDDLAAHIGVSIRATGKAQQGMVEGREGAIISELTAARSVDFVTAPGAGGKVLSLFEAARGVVQNKTAQAAINPSKENSMDEKEFEALKESNATLQKKLEDVEKDNARMKEAQALREARDYASAELGKQQLPDVTRTRLLESLAKAAPMKDGALDKEAFAKQIAEAVKAESAYLQSILGSGAIRGLGGNGSGVEDHDDVSVSAVLESAFSELGLSEASAKTAAKGRA